MKKLLQDKTVLFITPSYFGYEDALSGRMTMHGATVLRFDERPSNTVLGKGLIRMKRSWLRKKIAKYYAKITEQTRHVKLDFFLLIKGESVPIPFLKELKKLHPETVFIYYNYDSVVEYPHFKSLFPYFDRNFTFEAIDAEMHNLQLRTAFFLPQYAEAAKKPPKYDLVFIGSAHTDRYFVGEKVRQILEGLGKKSFFHYYAPGRTALRLKRIFDKNFQQFDLKKVSFTIFSHAEIAEVFQSSVAVLDINKPFQFGVSMRSFEVLASGRKLITTNAEVANYDFYNPNNILIIDRNSPEIDPAFFETPFEPIPEDLLQKMSIDGWLKDIFFPSGDGLRKI